VIVKDKDSKTEHTVTVDEECYARLTDRKISKEELIKKPLKFLLAREPKGSMLRGFNLGVIKRCFLEYEEKIKSIR